MVYLSNVSGHTRHVGQSLISWTSLARTIALFYFLLAFSHCIAAVLRGSGHAAVPMIVMLCVWCLFRVSYITVAVHYIPDIRGEAGQSQQPPRPSGLWQ